MKRMKLAEARLEEVRWIDLPSNRDERGVLTSVESEQDAPFAIKRIFYMHHVASDRGGHAHMDTDQVVMDSHAIAGANDSALIAACDSLTAQGQTNFRSEEHTAELQSRRNRVCRLLPEKKKHTHTKNLRHSPPLVTVS